MSFSLRHIGMNQGLKIAFGIDFFVKQKLSVIAGGLSQRQLQERPAHLIGHRSLRCIKQIINTPD